MASRTPARPLSPHLGIYRWGPHMLVSILHRAAGSAMAIVGVPLFLWWVAAIAAGPAAYATFHHVFAEVAGGAIGYLVGFGLSVALFLHLGNGVRHLFLDTGALFELRRNKLSALAVLGFAAAATVLFWFFVVVVK